MQYKYAIAITGGIAVGKSTTKSLLYLHGYRCIDADIVSHKILNESYKDIGDIFGKDYIVKYKDMKNSVNRQKLGKLIFKDKKAKKQLENYMHPKIQQEIQTLASKEEEKKFTYFIDIPLFFETKNYNIEKSLVVYTPKDIQLQRLIKRDNFSKKEALMKIESQMDIELKVKLATYIVDNSKDLKHLQKECDEFMKKIQ